MSTLKILFRIVSLLSLLGGVIGGGLMLAGGTTAALNQEAGMSAGTGFAMIITYTWGIGLLVSGIIGSMVFWWVGNVHDYLLDISRK